MFFLSYVEMTKSRIGVFRNIDNFKERIHCFDKDFNINRQIVIFACDIKNFGNGIVRPSVIETDSPLYKGYKSIMVYGKITPKEFSDEAFTLDNLSKVENLRR